MAKFIHGDRVVHMIDVPLDDIADFILNIQEQFDEEQAQELIKQLMDELEQMKKDND